MLDIWIALGPSVNHEIGPRHRCDATNTSKCRLGHTLKLRRRHRDAIITRTIDGGLHIKYQYLMSLISAAPAEGHPPPFALTILAGTAVAGKVRALPAVANHLNRVSHSGYPRGARSDCRTSQFAQKPSGDLQLQRRPALPVPGAHTRE